MSSFRSVVRSTLATLPGASRGFRYIYFLKERAKHRAVVQALGTTANVDTSRARNIPLLIGYLELGLGLGQYARGLATSLDAVGFPFSVYPYRAFTDRNPVNTSWRHRYDVTNNHSVNVFCMAADQTKLARRIIGEHKTRSSYNILSTFWELARAPEAWRNDLTFFDEIWAPNTFVADAFRPIFKKEICIVPPCVQLDAPTVANRSQFGLSDNIFYFLFSFDYNSHPVRKNPLAVINAFKRAFAINQRNVGLVVKVNGNPRKFPDLRDKLRDECACDPRIATIHEEMGRDRILSLFAGIDCYVSLHRSEGFGLGMAEAMLLNKPVIGTDYSGNTDFLTEATGLPVPFHFREVGNDYPNGDGQRWAEADVEIAATFMQQVFDNPENTRRRAEAGQKLISSAFGANTCGRIAAARLQLRLTDSALSGSRPR